MEAEPVFEYAENGPMMKSSLSMATNKRTNSQESHDRQTLLKKQSQTIGNYNCYLNHQDGSNKAIFKPILSLKNCKT